MNKTKLAGTLGLCMRSGNLRCGAMATDDAIKKGKAVLILLTSDAAPSHRVHLEHIAPGAEVADIGADSSFMLGSVGRSCCIAAVTDKNFVTPIKNSLMEE
ncbi:MAG: ribosomal L7Ae/L30e/S12e/Gadd45 family protein [Clostridia bacterium]|nr:ribosomal L7Ae/L30e/S12e/Gadd45 family protein [Clostridia bacterium]